MAAPCTLRTFRTSPHLSLYMSLPRRIPSHHLAEQSLLNPNDSLRSVSSSSASILSTPSNNIRKVQHHPQHHPQNHPILGRSNHQGGVLEPKSRKRTTPRPRTKTAPLKSKLLDLQLLRKYAKPTKQTSFSTSFGPGYDYSVFVDATTGELGPRAVKESQVKAWESAERIAANVIFDSDSEDEVESATPTRNPEPTTVLEAIPGYTKDEVKTMCREFDTHGFNSQPIMSPTLGIGPIETYQYRQDQQLTQFASFAGKRKQQVSNKKELISRLFGYNNNLNQEYMTNNTAYSALDNVLNIQKAFHEDKDEVKQLIECEQEYQMVMQEARIKFERGGFAEDENMDRIKVRGIVGQKLDMIYNRYLHERLDGPDGRIGQDEDILYDDLNRYILDHLRHELEED